MISNKIAPLLPEYLLHSEIFFVVITDMEGKYLFVNDVFKKRFAFITQEWEGKDSFIAIYPEDHQVCLKAVEQCFNNPDKVVKVHLRKPATNQNDFYWTQWEFSVFKDQDQNHIGILCLGNDITETERASLQAKEFAQKVDTIIEEITEGFYQLNRDWKFVKINKVAEQILGIPREQLLGRKIWDLFPDTPDYNYTAAYRKAMTENISVTFEDYRPDLDRWFSAVVYPSVEGLTVFFRDITQKKKYIDTIKQQEYMLRAIYQSTSEASTFIDKNFIIRYNNQVAQNITQQVFGKKAQIGDNSLDYVLPEYQAEFKEFYRKALLGENIVVERTDGTNWWQLSMYPVYGEQQQIIGIAHNVQDITEKKQKELQLQENEERLQKTIEAIPHPLLIVNEDMQIQYVNEEFEQVFGYTSDEVLSKTVDFLLPERFRAGHSFLQKNYLEQGGKTVKKMGRFLSALTKGGKEIVIDGSLNTFSINKKKYVIVILQDVTELKQRQDTILKQNEILQKIAWQQSHEVRRPVANILGLCDLLKNYPNETTEIQKQYIDYMLKATQELDEIIHRIVKQTNEK
ncbi:MAG: hypothetical protein Fur0027_22230 [Raineya sp.]